MARSIAVLELSEEEKKQLRAEIGSFFSEELELETGMIRQQLILDFFIEQLGPMIYNRALDDAQRWYRRQQENLESDFYIMYKNK